MRGSSSVQSIELVRTGEKDLLCTHVAISSSRYLGDEDTVLRSDRHVVVSRIVVGGIQTGVNSHSLLHGNFLCSSQVQDRWGVFPVFAR